MKEFSRIYIMVVHHNNRVVFSLGIFVKTSKVVAEKVESLILGSRKIWTWRRHAVQ